MKIELRRFQASDRVHIVRCLEGLQDYLVAIDEMKFTRRMPEYGEYFTRRLLENVNGNNGVIYVAENGDKSIEVLEPSVRAHRFYQRLGYQDRIIDVLKKLKT